MMILVEGFGAAVCDRIRRILELKLSKGTSRWGELPTGWRERRKQAHAGHPGLVPCITFPNNDLLLTNDADSTWAIADTQ